VNPSSRLRDSFVLCIPENIMALAKNFFKKLVLAFLPGHGAACSVDMITNIEKSLGCNVSEDTVNSSIFYEYC
jgi:hypothetical protein